ncbi:uncharacterized protein LOC106883640 [Octopus bimaculoides]|uniref:uncharacterized protein LOC106883640 n=1 Tax=Octopus bimaculoides TaxID=37653 RepID=UPI0022DF3D10|nr:uncharacterized protein LOC106883640 [Octopus bimaculoides]
MEITCSYVIANLIMFKLMQNNSSVVKIEYNKIKTAFLIKSTKNNFKCDLPIGEKVKCWKDNLQCEDEAQYECQTNSPTSSPKFLKAKSYIKSLQDPYPFPAENQISTFRCDANAAKSETVVIFKWTVKHGNNADGEETIDRVQVSSRSSCITPVQSDYKYNVTIKDSSNTTITCTVFSESLSKTISIPGLIPATEGPVVATAGK